MAHIILNKDKLYHNYKYLNAFFKDQEIEWSVVTKILCGNKCFLEVLFSLDIKSFSDSRISNLKIIKNRKPDCTTIYIKPPAKGVISEIIKYADVSLNSSLYTIKLLDEEAKKNNKKHQIILMIDLGELREGVMREDFLELFDNAHRLSNIEIIGIGSNLSCLYGILPNSDKLNQLYLYKQLVELKYKTKLKYISGGSSVTIPLLQNKLIDSKINHFRIGETLFMGTNAYDQSNYKELKQNVFELCAEIIELYEKPLIPSGEMGTSVTGDIPKFNLNDLGKKSIRALIDIGLLDVDIKYLNPIDDHIKIEAATSDIIVLKQKKNEHNYAVGSIVTLQLDYMGIVRIMNSRYIDKVITT